ncbi:hypothetical protein [Hafnia phage Pocis76]|uniref:Uncharacterized protein n=1 Tax=Hafnia phage Pocis76 TaxID=2831174 RepID=A0A8E7FN91_9CAUD|nr:hypothetical protein [Hafnia phage Pocis76]
MIGATYYKEMAVAMGGQVSDTSRYNIDGNCVLGGARPILCGQAVHVEQVLSDGTKEVQHMAENKVPYGVAIRSHFATITTPDGQMAYDVGDGVNVMTVGRVWLIAERDFTPTFGSVVTLTTDGKAKEQADGGVAPTGWTYAGGKTKFGDTTLLEVQLHQL